MKNLPKKTALRTQQIISLLLMFGLVAMIAYISTKNTLTFDWTANKRNELHPATIKVLQKLPNPIEVIGFMRSQSPMRAAFIEQIQRYQKFTPKLTYKFIDPAQDPITAQKYNISQEDVVVLSYDKQQETLPPQDLTENSLTNAIQRLVAGKNAGIYFLSGHGEHPLNGQDQLGYAFFAQNLQEKGFKVAQLTLAENPQIPKDIQVLVIAGNTHELLAGEVNLIQDYVNKGGNVLWLSDPNSPDIAELAASLNIQWQKGTILFASYQQLGMDSPAMIPMLKYPDNPVLKPDFNETSLYLLAQGVKIIENPTWESTPFLVAMNPSWLEKGDLNKPPLVQDSTDIAGPVPFGWSLVRNRPNAPVATPDKPNIQTPKQRVIVIGDSDFLANTLAQQQGNLQIGLNMIQWLSDRDSDLMIDIPDAVDSTLNIPTWLEPYLYWCFVLILPLGILLLGVMRWIMRGRR